MNYSGKNLKYLINKLEISQASIEFVVKKRQQTISNWSSGKSLMDADDLIHITDFFGLTLEDFCLTDLSKGNLITQEYISKFRQKGNLKGNPKGNPMVDFNQNTGDDWGGTVAPKIEGDMPYWIIVNLLKQVLQRLDNLEVSIKNQQK